MNSSYVPRLHEYPLSTFGTQRVRRTTSQDVSIRLAAERWTLRSRPSR